MCIKGSVTCDCGCGAKREFEREPSVRNWFVLTQPEPDRNSSIPKLERPLQFSSLECLLKWAGTAADKYPPTVRAYGSMHPRGMTQVVGVEGLYI